ncbi:hypothetical protein ACM26V_15500 [Salipaludibacillus sp. HK11]|uniref:hypothetical protein n=1 Tax=Salipaludibacillus sp. HK11 TaxID=3394320 RepID=UPI0039FDCD16
MQDRLLADLNKKWILNDMKLRVIKVVCNLIDDECYMKSDAIVPLLEVVELMEQQEKMIDPKTVDRGDHLDNDYVVHEKTHAR